MSSNELKRNQKEPSKILQDLSSAAIVVKKPSECSERELEAFEAFVIKGGEVTAEGLRDLIKKAKGLVFLFEGDNTLAGIAALKYPNIGYKNRVFKKARAQEDPDKFTFEVGWIYVERQFRGRKYSHFLLEALLKLADENQVYATTREDNKAMQSTLIRYGFQQSGFSYVSKRRDCNLLLLTRPLLQC